ncbi:hypothetical protein ACWCPF_29260 [Streptomyces sp. NPDC001858]
MTENEVTASPDIEVEPSGQVDPNRGRVSVWVQDHTPLAIAIAGLLSALFTLLAANPMIVSIFSPGGVSKAARVTAEVAEPSGGKISQDEILEVSGSFDGTLQGRSLWAFVKNIDNGTLWPSYEPCSIAAAEGKWSCKVTPLPKVSELQVRLVDSRGVNEILQWVIKINAGSAPALNEVSGSEVLAQRTLSR